MRGPRCGLARCCEEEGSTGYLQKADSGRTKGDEKLSTLTSNVKSWSGQEVFDTEGARIGKIVGRAYPRRRFGVTWLLLQVGDGRTVPIPAEQMTASGAGFVLPYSLRYVEAAPVVGEGLSTSQADERRLRYHYGIVSGGPSGGCRAGCGLCMANKREIRRSAVRDCGDGTDA